MDYFFKPSFVNIFKKLDPLRKKQIIEAIEALKVVLGSKQSIEGLGLKRLSKDLWEMRSSLKDRIAFNFKNDVITFVVVGNHDDIQKYLKNN